MVGEAADKGNEANVIKMKSSAIICPCESRSVEEKRPGEEKQPDCDIGVRQRVTSASLWGRARTRATAQMMSSK
ncbi:uncharacterized [Tachysurus ichikawai]